MTQPKFHIFCVNTPFQLLVVEAIISQYFNRKECLIISTIKGEDFNERVLSIDKSLNGFKDLRYTIKHVIKQNVENSEFYVPHLGSLLSSIFYELSKEYHRPINIYYEGVALYYNPIVKQSLLVRAKRYILALLLCEKYHYHEQLYPEELVENVSVCYAPKLDLLEKYKRVRLFSLNQGRCNQESALLLLLSNTIADMTFKEILKVLNNIKNEFVINTLYIKPHYELDDTTVNKIASSIENDCFNKVLILDSRKPIESFYNNISFSIVVSQVFSSALINMKLIFESQPRIYVIDKDPETSRIAQKFGLKYE